MLAFQQSISQYCDLDEYLQKELEKLQQEEKEECENKKACVNIRDKSPSGQRSPISVTSPNTSPTPGPHVTNARRQKLKTKSSSSYKDSNKKTFTCTFNGCTKNYVKSSHLKVKISSKWKCTHTIIAISGSHTNPHRGEAICVQLVRMRLEVRQV